MCTGPYHCRGTEDRGPCNDPRDHCFERALTASPTSLPTSSTPTAAPTPLPTANPTSSTPTAVPTAAPTGMPSRVPTMVYPTDVMGRPVFPTDAAGSEFYMTDWRRQPIVPTDQWGEIIRPRTIASTDSSTVVPTEGPSNADGSTGKDKGGSSSTDAIIAVIVVALLLVVGIVVGAIRYVKNTSAKTGDRPARMVVPAGGFGNPVYDSALSEFDGAQQSSGYTDVPGGSRGATASTGYMDVAPGGVQQATGYMDVAAVDDAYEDDAEEDV